MGRALEQANQPGARPLAILDLRSEDTTDDDQNVIARDVPSRVGAQTLFDVDRQRRCAQVDTQLDRGGIPVGVLPMGPRGAHKALRDFAVGEGERIGDVNHGFSAALNVQGMCRPTAARGRSDSLVRPRLTAVLRDLPQGILRATSNKSAVEIVRMACEFFRACET